MKKSILFLSFLLYLIVSLNAQTNTSKFKTEIIFAPDQGKSLFCCLFNPDLLKTCFCNRMIKILGQGDTDATQKENECVWTLTKTKIEEGNYKVSFEFIGPRVEVMQIFKALKKSSTITQTFEIKEIKEEKKEDQKEEPKELEKGDVNK